MNGLNSNVKVATELLWRNYNRCVDIQLVEYRKTLHILRLLTVSRLEMRKLDTYVSCA